MMKAMACCLLLLLFLGKGKIAAQNAVPVFGDKTSFETGKVMKKVIVCVEDQSVWALSDGGKVFYKLSGASGFSAFPATENMFVVELAGYNANEMYFLAFNKLYQVKNMGTPAEVTLPGSSGQELSNIAVVHASRNPCLEGYHGTRDWLAVATLRTVHCLFRDNGAFGVFNPVFAGSTPNIKITNSGYKSLDFEYRVFAPSPCFGNLTTAYYNKVGDETTEVLLPEIMAGSRESVICTYFEAPYNQQKDGGKRGFEYWSNSEGLFMKRAGNCEQADVRKILNVGVNDLEELNFFRDIFNTRMILAAANDGLYVGNSNPGIIPPVNGPPGGDQMVKVAAIDAGVNSIGLEINGSCETAVWLATRKGIVRLPLVPAYRSVDKNTLGSYGELVSVDAGLKDYYCVSNGEEYRFRVNLPNNDAVNYTVQWLWHRQNYADRTELPGTAGTIEQTFKTGGEYGVRITSACGERVDIGGFWLRDPEPVVVDFNYPSVVPLLKGCTFTFRARSGNKYKWEKDGAELEGETSNVLVAKGPGVYTLSYEDYCNSRYTPVASVELKETEFPEPVVTLSRAGSLCYGEDITLTVSDPGIPGITFRWKKDGIAISGGTSGTLVVKGPGNYSVDFVGGDGATCYRPSRTIPVTTAEQLNLQAPSEVQICTITNQRLKLTAPEGFVKYTWDGVAGTVNYLEVDAPGQYALEVEDAAGCTAEALYIVVPYCPPPVPPNAFSPNGDGEHDTWTVAELNNDPQAILRIYNRYGVLIFTGTNRKLAWDGRFKGTDSPVGTYYYVITQKKSAKAVTGSLTLIR